MTTSPVKIVGKNVQIQPAKKKGEDVKATKASAKGKGLKSPLKKLFGSKSSEEGIGAKMMKLVKSPLGGPSKKKQKKSSNRDKSASEPCLSSTSTSSKESRVSTLSLASSSTNNSKRRKSRRNWPKKKGNSVRPHTSSGEHHPHGNQRLEQQHQLVFTLDVKTQMTRLVTPRQRQELYALNRIMTRLENEKFNRFLYDRTAYNSAGGSPEILDIFM
eukprot:TRINITY_DN8031_c0_g1_i1.p1 TRINITY_DN8031_c0_g1~~TRINITY_DN8031_c0_g1_i1.p1  ORF type:complete len:223 (+),score=67.29 TRINITY_DN8031_c0_g1_i1:23-670(+)